MLDSRSFPIFISYIFIFFQSHPTFLVRQFRFGHFQSWHRLYSSKITYSKVSLLPLFSLDKGSDRSLCRARLQTTTLPPALAPATAAIGKAARLTVVFKSLAVTTRSLPPLALTLSSSASKRSLLPAGLLLHLHLLKATLLSALQTLTSIRIATVTILTPHYHKHQRPHQSSCLQTPQRSSFSRAQMERTSKSVRNSPLSDTVARCADILRSGRR